MEDKISVKDDNCPCAAVPAKTKTSSQPLRMHLDAVDPRPIRVALHKLHDALPGTGYLWNSKVLKRQFDP